ncbi:MAG: primosomal protein N' (replication factor Y) (superfamily II helicase) [Rhodospirillaceae bacterium]|nr:MAG: primosomal protein N' (replication factor Y) (superfamily II helicase) [Rhodospirillaceae bacterium]
MNEGRVAVLLPLPLAGPYAYGLPAAVNLMPGAFVRVPLGKRIETGVVWSSAGVDKIDAARLRPVLATLDVSPLPEIVMRFVDWVAAYTLAPPGAVLKMAMSVPTAVEKPPPLSPLCYRCVQDRMPERLTPARRRVLVAAIQTPGQRATDLARAAGTSPAVVRSLVESGLLEAIPLPSSVPVRPDPDHARPLLSPVQGAAAAELVAAVQADRFSVTLLEGVTGSGKTEVYFEAVAEALRRDRQVLVLLPEIVLTAQWLERFAARFGLPPALWHSNMTQAARREVWRAVAHGEAQVVVGARSALFLPYPALGLIVVDEEHEPAFKQEDGVIYQGRDMAVVRGRLGDHAVILASATPSLETQFNVAAKRYGRVRVTARHGVATLPAIAAIDMRRMPPERGAWGRSWLAPPLVHAIQETLAAGEQVMVFLNRRGYAPLTVCRLCGFRFRCPHCTAWLVEHRHSGLLRCHHCGHGVDPPRACPHCGGGGPFAVCGPGVERIAEEVADRFPTARLAVMTSDTLEGPTAAAALVGQMETGALDMLVGTQMMAKGHHFPRLTLVGVVDADLGLAGGDLRAAERTFQLLSQVAGRAGRAERPGRVLVQTYDPAHPVMAALLSGDAEAFYERESMQRQESGMPPFGRLAALIVSGLDAAEVENVAADLARHGPHGVGIAVLGPVPAPLALLRDRHRHRLLLKTSRGIPVQPLLRAWLGKVTWPRSVRVQVDVDPYSFL